MAPRSGEWAGLSTPIGFERCVRGSLRELYGYLALLSGRSRAEAERHVVEVYRSLFRAVQAGKVETVSLGSLRSAGRHVWLDEHRAELALTDEVLNEPASTIDSLSSLERAVVVFLHVNGMSPSRAASEIGRSEQEVTVLGRHAVRRLRGTTDTSGAWLRAYFGPFVSPATGLVDRIIRDLAPTDSPAPPDPPASPDPPDAPDAVDEALPATHEFSVVVPDVVDAAPVGLGAPETDTVESGVVESGVVESETMEPLSAGSEPPVETPDGPSIGTRERRAAPLADEQPAGPEAGAGGAFPAPVGEEPLGSTAASSATDGADEVAPADPGATVEMTAVGPFPEPPAPVPPVDTPVDENPDEQSDDDVDLAELVRRSDSDVGGLGLGLGGLAFTDPPSAAEPDGPAWIDDLTPPEGRVAAGAAPGDTSEGSVTDGAVPGEPVSDVTMPLDAVPVDAVPVDAVPVDTALVDTVPADSSLAPTTELPATASGAPLPPPTVVRSTIDDSGGTRRPGALGGESLGDHDSDLFDTSEPIERARTTLVSVRRSRTSWLVPVGVALVLAALVVAWWYSREDAADTSAPAVTAPVTTAPSGETSTDAASSGETSTDTTTDSVADVPATTPTTSTLPPEDRVIVEESTARFDPTCTSWVAGAAPDQVEVRNEFGSLASAPAYVVSLPVTDAGDAVAVRVDGVGGALLLQAVADGDEPAAMLARVDLDGSVRWVRCSDQVPTVKVQPNDDIEFAIGLTQAVAEGEDETLRVWYRPSLGDGGIELPVDPVTALALDIIDGRPDDIAVPGAVLWDETGLFGLDADGDIAWTDDAVHRPDGAAQAALRSGGVAVAAVCLDAACEQQEVRGYDADSGLVLWSAVGFDAVAAAGDGWALIGHPVDGWDVVETDFGQPVDGQHWPDPATFAPADAGGLATTATYRIGGLLAVVRDGELAIWLPVGGASGLVAVDLTAPG